MLGDFVSRNNSAADTSSTRPNTGAKTKFSQKHLNIDKYLNIEDNKDEAEPKQIEEVDNSHDSRRSSDSSIERSDKFSESLSFAEIKKT